MAEQTPGKNGTDVLEVKLGMTGTAIIMLEFANIMNAAADNANRDVALLVAGATTLAAIFPETAQAAMRFLSTHSSNHESKE